MAVPHFEKLLEFVNLRVQASETTITDVQKRPAKTDSPTGKKTFVPAQPVASFSANADTSWVTV